MYSSSFPCLSAADWCLQSDVAPDSRLQVLLDDQNASERMADMMVAFLSLHQSSIIPEARQGKGGPLPPKELGLVVQWCPRRRHGLDGGQGGVLQSAAQHAPALIRRDCCHHVAAKVGCHPPCVHSTRVHVHVKALVPVPFSLSSLPTPHKLTL